MHKTHTQFKMGKKYITNIIQRKLEWLGRITRKERPSIGLKLSATLFPYIPVWGFNYRLEIRNMPMMFLSLVLHPLLSLPPHHYCFVVF
jgi:hypothetical protein